MGQITIYIDDELESQIRAATEHRKISRSRWIADLIRQHLESAWPAEVRESAGSWADFPDLEELRGDLRYESRESF